MLDSGIAQLELVAEESEGTRDRRVHTVRVDQYPGEEGLIENRELDHTQRSGLYNSAEVNGSSQDEPLEYFLTE